jgi:Zn-dependent oligopeptidase
MSPGEAVPEASNRAANILDECALETTMREDLFLLIAVVVKKSEELDDQDQHYLMKQHQMFVRNGLTLPPGSQRDRFKAIKER